jgi:hypothetical protein
MASSSLPARGAGFSELDAFVEHHSLDREYLIEECSVQDLKRILRRSECDYLTGDLRLLLIREWNMERKSLLGAENERTMHMQTPTRGTTSSIHRNDSQLSAAVTVVPEVTPDRDVAKAGAISNSNSNALKCAGTDRTFASTGSSGPGSKSIPSGMRYLRLSRLIDENASALRQSPRKRLAVDAAGNSDDDDDDDNSNQDSSSGNNQDTDSSGQKKKQKSTRLVRRAKKQKTTLSDIRTRQLVVAVGQRNETLLQCSTAAGLDVANAGSRVQDDDSIAVGHEKNSEDAEERALSRPPPCAGRYPIRIRRQASHGVSSDTAAQAHHDRWTPEEDTKLTSAVKTTCEKKWGKDWPANSALVPGRTNMQCWSRCHNALASKSDGTTARKGTWTAEEDSTLKDAVKKHNGKDWAAISELVLGRTKKQCWSKWNDALASKSDGTTARKGRWTKEEDSTLKDAVEKYNGEDWAAISELLPGRTKQQCNKRWHGALDSKSDETTARKGKWTKEEDSTLKDAVEKHNGKNWAASIAELVPGRTAIQCANRRQYV